ncbi:MAG TPA: hypothetical protein VFR94_08145 [Nitrososphaeraceae archaeon]|nr:hypothetical protein [Nitrososphaeraceae archaeon]
MTRMLLVSVTVVVTIPLIGGQEQPLSENRSTRRMLILLSK